MLRKFITLLFIFILIFSFTINKYNISYADNSSLNEIKTYFFNNNIEFNQMIKKLSDLKYNNIINDFTIYNNFQAISINGTSETLKRIEFDTKNIKIVDNIRLETQPILDETENNKFKDLWNIKIIEADKLWDMGITGKGIKLAVLDTGVDSNHIDLKGKLVDWAEFTQSGKIIKNTEPYDSGGHGTHVSGIALGGSISHPLGVAPDATLSVGLVLPNGSGQFAQIIGGLEWTIDPDGNPETRDNPRIVNLSLGATGYYKIWTPIFKKLLDNNILPVCAIGNDGDGLSIGPGNCPNTLAVGSFDKNANPSSFSSGSDNITWEDDLYIKNYTKPDVSAPGSSVYSSVPGNKYEAWSGTSMASPHVAGSAALLMQAFPEATAYDIWYYIVKGSIDAGRIGVDSRYGAGKLNLLSSYKLLSQGIKFSGKLSNYYDGLSLNNVDTGFPIYIDKNGFFSTILPKGYYNINVKYKDDIIKNTIINVDSNNISMDIDVPELKKTRLEGVIKDNNSNPIEATIAINENIYKADKFGRFDIEVNNLDKVYISATGFETKTITSNISGYLNIRLNKADLLLIEGISSYEAVTNPPRLAKKYFIEALEKLNTKYSYLDLSKSSFSYESIKGYSDAIYFCDSGGISQSEEEVLKKYLDNGGRLFISGRMVLYSQNYYRQTFLYNYFGVSTKEMLFFPSVKGNDRSDDFKDMFFSLSGDSGANNQENCDIISLSDKNISEPILNYVETNPDKYAGVKVSTGIYKGVILGFGLEGISSQFQRLTLLRNILNWFKNSGSLECEFVTDSEIRASIIRSDNRQFTANSTDKKLILKNLELMRYKFIFEGYGFENSENEFDFSKITNYKLRLKPKVSRFYNITVLLTTDKESLKTIADIKYMNKVINTIEFNTSNPLILKLPVGFFEVLISTKNHIQKQLLVKIVDSDLRFDVKMDENNKKVLIVDDSNTGNVYFDNFLRIGELYLKYFSSSKIPYDYWSVSKDGFPNFSTLLQYEIVYYIGSRNDRALTNAKNRNELTKYLNNNGNLILNGNNIHTAVTDQAFFSEYFGIELNSANIRECTVTGSKDTEFGSMVFDVFDPYVKLGTYLLYPSFNIVKTGAKSIFTYFNGGISSTFYNSGKFKTIYIPFGIENIAKNENKEQLIINAINSMTK